MENLQQQQDETVKKVIWVAVKEQARELIGQPKPTKVRGNRKPDGRHRAGVQGALDIYEDKNEDGELLDAPRLATNPILHGGAITNIPSRYLNDLRQKRHEHSTIFHFSKEIIDHANFLQQTQGKPAMDQFLHQAKEQAMTMSHEQIMNDAKHEGDKKLMNVGGGIEQELTKVEARAKHCREEAGRLESEADNLDRIALKLRETLDMLGGKETRQTRGPGLGKGTWTARFKEVLTAPMNKAEFYRLTNQR